MYDDRARYDERPILRFADAYVLDAMGMLSQKDEQQFAELAPQFRAAVGAHCGTWQGIVAEVVGLPLDATPRIRRLWKSAQDQARQQGTAIDAADFARFIVDAQMQAAEMAPVG